MFWRMGDEWKGPYVTDPESLRRIYDVTPAGKRRQNRAFYKQRTAEVVLNAGRYGLPALVSHVVHKLGIGAKDETDEKGYAPPGGGSKRSFEESNGRNPKIQRIENGKTIQAHSRKSSKMPTGRKGGKYPRKRYMQQKKRFPKKGKPSKQLSKNQLSKFLKRSLAYHSKWPGKASKRVAQDSGSISTAANVVQYTALYLNEASTLEAALETFGPRRITYDEVTAKWTERPVSLDHNATDRPYVESFMRVTKPTHKLMVIRNNDIVSADIQFFEYVCVDSTNSTPFALFQEAIDDAAGGDEDEGQELYSYPNQYQTHISHKWKLRKTSRTFRLDPASEIKYFMKGGYGIYSTQMQAHVTNTYYKGCTACLLIRTTGVIANNGVGVVGLQEVVLDYVEVDTRSGKYSSQTDRRQVSWGGAMDTIGATPKQAQPDVEQNN